MCRGRRPRRPFRSLREGAVERSETEGVTSLTNKLPPSFSYENATSLNEGGEFELLDKLRFIKNTFTHNKTTWLGLTPFQVVYFYLLINFLNFEYIFLRTGNPFSIMPYFKGFTFKGWYRYTEKSRWLWSYDFWSRRSRCTCWWLWLWVQCRRNGIGYNSKSK